MIKPANNDDVNVGEFKKMKRESMVKKGFGIMNFDNVNVSTWSAVVSFVFFVLLGIGSIITDVKYFLSVTFEQIGLLQFEFIGFVCGMLFFNYFVVYVPARIIWAYIKRKK